MSLTKRQEAYAQAVATDELEGLDAMANAGYKSKNKANAERQLKNLRDNPDVQNRIIELRAIELIESGDSLDNEDDEVVEIVNALHFFQTIYKNKRQPLKARINCAAIAIGYEEPKPAAIGKKEQTVIDAKQGSKTGRFATLSNQPDMLSTKNIQ